MEDDLLSVIEAVLARHPYIAECAVIGVYDSIKGQVPIAIIALKDNIIKDPQDIRVELISAVNKELGKIGSLRTLCIVPELPRNNSTDISKDAIKTIADGGDIAYVGDIKNPSSLSIIRDALRDMGYARRSSEFFVGCGGNWKDCGGGE